MQFGVQFFPEIDPNEKSAAQYFNECLAVAELSETLGFTHARIVEHYFHRYGGLSPNPIVFLSALSQRTKTMRLVTGAVLPVFNHPLKLAGEIGMIDAISNGRIDVGFARAFLPHEFRRFGISPDESNARFREGLEQITMLLEQENVTHRGRFHVIENTTSLPRPTQKPRPKFYIAATQTPETFAFAGRQGHALMAIPLGAKLRELINLYREEWRRAGHSGNGEVMIAFHMFCHEDGSNAREIARAPFQSYFRAFAEVTEEWEHMTSSNYRDYGTSMGKLKAVTLERQIEAGSAWIGSPEEIKASIAQFVETVGPFEHASLQINFNNLPFADAERSLHLFAREVLPQFTQH